MAHGPYWADLPVDGVTGKHFVSPTKWDQLVNNIIAWQSDRDAGGHSLTNLGAIDSGADAVIVRLRNAAGWVQVQSDSGVNRLVSLNSDATATLPLVINGQGGAELVRIAANGYLGVLANSPIAGITLGGTTAGKFIQYGVSATTTENFHTGVDGSAPNAKWAVWSGNYGSGTNLLTVLQNGCVGICKIPDSRLDILGAGSGAVVLQINANNAASANLRDIAYIWAGGGAYLALGAVDTGEAGSSYYSLSAWNGATPVAIALPKIRTTLAAHANNAAAVAAGLVAGDLYRTGGDPDAVCIVH